ncbi:DUF4142 domain-containing protein [Pseudomonas capeferrum]|uniref:DUF4142 domain-containing protein n=1 Tax=Pseudomonas capeferrum TaxID=1495066 RepID=UPI0015E2B1DD|nr:DUF4142 domain-containing protein [Pseudomonas capeferrum]MBA1200225.1 DUF4142 domain-containing protein [Pseudomonas capeferrum]
MPALPYKPSLLALILAFMMSGPTQAATSDSTFVNEAATAAIAEIQSSQLALEKSGNPQVKAFAQRMIDDHDKANRELFDLAKDNGFDVPDEATLAAKADRMMLQVQDGASFDAAYVRHQVDAHEHAIRLFEAHEESATATEPLRMYAHQTLPVLKHHLEAAMQLQKALPIDDNGARKP